MAYASKAMCGESASPPDWAGRTWGVCGRENLPIELVTEEISWPEFFSIRRVLGGWALGNRQFYLKRFLLL